MTPRLSPVLCHTARRAWTACLLGVLVLGGAAASAQVLFEPSAWETLGEPRYIEGFGFTGDPDEPLIWSVGQGTWTLQDVSEPWTEVNDKRPANGEIWFYGPDPAVPDTIVGGSPLYRSVDGGKTFDRMLAAVNLGGSDGIDGPAFGRIPAGAPHAHRLVAADGLGLLFSDDGGDSWAVADTTPPLLAFSIQALRSGRLIAAGFYGAVLSDDGGQTWRHIPDLYDTTRIGFDVQRLTVLPGLVTGQPGDSAEGRLVLTGTSAGVDGGWYQWSSDDEGETWTRRLQPGDAGCGNGVDILPLAAETGRPGDALAVTCVGAVLRSEDGAETWARIGQVPNMTNANVMRTAALGPDGRLYVGISDVGPQNVHSYRTRWRASNGFAVASGERPEVPALRLSARPNPVRQLVVVELAESAPASGPSRRATVLVVDAQGREVARGRVAPGASWRLDVRDWAPGLYRALVTGGEGAVEPVSFTVVR